MWSEESNGKHNVRDQIEQWSRNRSIEQSTNHSTLQYPPEITNLKKKPKNSLVISQTELYYRICIGTDTAATFHNCRTTKKDSGSE